MGGTYILRKNRNDSKTRFPAPVWHLQEGFRRAAQPIASPTAVPTVWLGSLRSRRRSRKEALPSRPRKQRAASHFSVVRFSKDFMFRLTDPEFANLRSQFGTSSA